MTETTATAARVALHTREPGPAVSPTLYGLFLEDINFACDGGLNANLVNNHSFAGAYLERGTVPYIPLDLVPEEHRERVANTPPELIGRPPSTPAGPLSDPLRHWTVRGGALDIGLEDPVVEGGRFARVHVAGATELDNHGYPGGVPGMSFTADGPLTFDAVVRADGYTGECTVQLRSTNDELVAEAPVVLGDDVTGWTQVTAHLAPTATSLGFLRIVFRGTGTIELDEVRLIADDHWGAGDPRWSQGVLRRDLVEALAALEPRFLRFPGGCIVEGCGNGSQYRWKDTVGPLVTRTPAYNLWGQSRDGGDYSQSFQVGFYEYFLLCEDLGMEPIPVVWSGDSCQTRMDRHLDVDSEEFAEVVQDAVDLIDWATGDPASSPLAALRAEAGHPAPFPLTYIGVGNENFGPEYLAHFARIKSALDTRRDGLQLIVTGGVVLPGEDGDQAWARWGHDPEVLVDEHFYNPPSWFFDASERYSSYPRGGAKVFLGEYAAHTPYEQPVTHPVLPESTVPEPNTWLSALAEAAFLTGVERNADIVAFSCYAPLFNLVEHGQWKHNLIDFSPSRVMPTANYLVQQLFATRIGTRVVPTGSELPAGAFLSATADDDDLHLKLVNITQSPIELLIDVDGVVDGRVDAVSLAASLGAVNRLTFTGEPQPEVGPLATHVEVHEGTLHLHLAPTSVLATTLPLASPNLHGATA